MYESIDYSEYDDDDEVPDGLNRGDKDKFVMDQMLPRRKHKMPENVYYYLQNLSKTIKAIQLVNIKKGSIYEIQQLYQNFPQLCDYYFDKSTWPDEEEVSLICDDKVFVILYKELYYRHIYINLSRGPSLDERINSFYNYCDFFNLVITSENPIQLELPEVWLWDIIDGFIHQFGQYSHYRACLINKTPEELSELSANLNVWNILCVLNVLHSLIDLSQIKVQLEAIANDKDPMTVAGKYGNHSLYRMLGYYSLIAMSHLQSILGDYYQSIKVLEPLSMRQKLPYLYMAVCEVQQAYHVGFAYMMMRRYCDATRTVTKVLLMVQRTKHIYDARSHHNNQINRYSEKMYYILSICLVLHPLRTDETIEELLQNHQESIHKMQCGDLDVFKTYFTCAAPNFINPCPPAPSSPPEDYSLIPGNQQLSVFMDEVRQQQDLPAMRSYLKLYTTLPVQKMATLIDPNATKDDEKNLSTRLLGFKHKMQNLVSERGNTLNGVMKPDSEVDFYIDDDMIHIADTTISPPIGDFFMRKIQTFEDLSNKLKNMQI